MSIYGVKNLPKSKWLTGISGDTEQVGLLSDCVDWETAILEYLGFIKPPPLIWINDATYNKVKVEATADSPARVLFAGFPDVLHSGQFINPADVSDGKLREITTDETLDLSTDLWGAEKPSTWYAIYATAADVDADFGLKAMPYLRVHTDVANVITTRNNLNAAAAFDYGLTADEFIDSYLYVLNGSKKGYAAKITDNGIGGGGTIITYDGSGLGLAAGDWFIILPATNFRWLGDVYNNASSNLTQIDDFLFGKWPYVFSTVGAYADPWFCPLLVDQILETGAGGGGGGQATYYGNPGSIDFKYPLSPTPGSAYSVTIGAGSINGDGGDTSLGSLRVLSGGDVGTNTFLNPASLGSYGTAGHDNSVSGGDGILILERAKQ